MGVVPSEVVSSAVSKAVVTGDVAEVVTKAMIGAVNGSMEKVEYDRVVYKAMTGYMVSRELYIAVTIAAAQALEALAVESGESVSSKTKKQNVRYHVSCNSVALGYYTSIRLPES